MHSGDFFAVNYGHASPIYFILIILEDNIDRFTYTKLPMHKIKMWLFCLLIVAANTITCAMAPATEAAIHQKIKEIQANMTTFVAGGYTQDADDLARKTTRTLLKPLANRIATPAEREAMVNAHLQAELYYAFNTKWGTGEVRDHRIVYDFLSQLDKAQVRTETQKQHLTIMTILSLAAQEYFWNEKSTPEDLKNRVICELRYGLFAQRDHKLDVSNIIYLNGPNLERLVEQWVNRDIIDKLQRLMAGFRADALGTTYAAIKADLLAKLAEVKDETIDLTGGKKYTINLSKKKEEFLIELDPEKLAQFGLLAVQYLKFVKSDGDGMCGEHSLFIPTDGALSRISEGNGRDKIRRAILDNSDNPEVDRFYLMASKHMDGSSFLKLMDDGEEKRKYERLDATESAAITEYQRVEKGNLLRSVSALPGLKAALEAFSKQLGDISAWTKNEESFRKFRNIMNELVNLGNYNASLRILIKYIETLRDAQITALEKECGLAKAETEKARAEWGSFYTSTSCDEYRKLSTEASEKKAAEKAAAEEALRKYNEKHPHIQKRCDELFDAYYAKKKEYDEKQKKLTTLKTPGKQESVEYYKLISQTLQGFIPLMLPNKGNAESFDIARLDERYCSFITEVCQGICELLGGDHQATADAIRSLWDNSNATALAFTEQKEKKLLLARIAIVKSPLARLPLTPKSLREDMLERAEDRGELSGWLPCDAIYTQLWAALNNLNVFVFAGKERGGMPDLNILDRRKDSFSLELFKYPNNTDGKHLATVILTSTTAKNVFLHKNPGHYDKLILPDDLAAMARAARHLAWQDLADPTPEELAGAAYPPECKYSNYP